MQLLHSCYIIVYYMIISKLLVLVLKLIFLLSVVMLVAVIVVGTTLSLLLYCTKKFHSRKFRHSSTNPDHVIQGDRQSGEDVEMKRCAAYQVVQLSRQRVTMKDNPAYVDVNIRTLT